MAEFVCPTHVPAGPIPLPARGLSAVLARVGPRGLAQLPQAPTAGRARCAYAAALARVGNRHIGATYPHRLEDSPRCVDAVKVGFAVPA